MINTDKEKNFKEKNVKESSNDGNVSKKKSNLSNKQSEKIVDDSKINTIELEQKIKDLEDKNLRLLAENENIRKIHTREIQDSQLYAIKEFALSLLTVVDNFQRARQAVPKDLPDDNLVKNLLIGFDAIEKELLETFERNGIKKFSCVNEKFNPEFHQAVSKMNSNDIEKGFVINELQLGFKIGDRLLRPAMVVVSEGPTEKNKIKE
tara:strand:+ start:148 stop:768 length:621 start_codon:yes stop_codon:yes gene_type:complete